MIDLRSRMIVFEAMDVESRAMIFTSF